MCSRIELDKFTLNFNAILSKCGMDSKYEQRLTNAEHKLMLLLMLVKFELKLHFQRLSGHRQTSMNDLWEKWTNNIGLLENDSSSG
jgi:hypothetical protein